MTTPQTEVHEYAYDTHLSIVVRVTAPTEERARAIVRAELQAICIERGETSGDGTSWRISEGSQEGDIRLFEIDDRNVEVVFLLGED